MKQMIQILTENNTKREKTKLQFQRSNANDMKLKSYLHFHDYVQYLQWVRVDCLYN